jgi:hypothetical protein
MVNAALQHATAMAMSGDLYAILTNRIINNLIIAWGHFVQALLDDMVAVQVLDEGNNVRV